MTPQLHAWRHWHSCANVSKVRISFYKFGHFRPPLSYINVYLAIDSGGNVSEYSSHVYGAWLECFPEKPSWCRNEHVCQEVKSKAI